MRLSIATKVFITFSGMVIVFAGVLIVGLFQTQRLYEQMHTLNRNIVPLSLLLSDAQNDLRSFDTALSEQDPENLKRTLQFAQLMSFVPRRFGGKLHRSMVLSNPKRFDSLDDSNLRRMQDIHDRLITIHDNAQALDKTTTVLQNALDTPTFDATTLEEVATKQKQARTQVRKLDGNLSKLRNDVRILTDYSLIKTSENERANTYALTLLSIFAILLALALLGIMLLTVRPLKLLTEGAKRVAQGDYTPLAIKHASVLGKDEIATLTDEFNSMARALKERDETLKTQHDALLRAERLATIGRMTSVVTHELRNPLSSIGLNAEMLSDAINETTLHQETQQDMLDHLELIVMEVDRLRDITEEYLVYARLPSPKFSRHDLADLIEQFIDFHRMEWHTHDILLDVKQRPLHVNIDPNQIKQALLNLIKNAVEAAPTHGPSQVDIKVWVEDEQVHIHIRDYGVGIDKPNQERIFEPFFTSKPQGTGLGLAMTLQIIESHKGTITLLDPQHGPGIIFALTFPKNIPTTVLDHDLFDDV